MSIKSEKYSSKAGMMKHEKAESPAMRMKEYGTKVKATPTPTAKPKVTNSTISKGEAEFIKALKNGKTLAEARKMIISKYGFSPNGRTN